VLPNDDGADDGGTRGVQGRRQVELQSRRRTTDTTDCLSPGLPRSERLESSWDTLESSAAGCQYEARSTGRYALEDLLVDDSSDRLVGEHLEESFPNLGDRLGLKMVIDEWGSMG
jgi:hypothetical protein